MRNDYKYIYLGWEGDAIHCDKTMEVIADIDSKKKSLHCQVCGLKNGISRLLKLWEENEK